MSFEIWAYALLSTFVVSLISLVGVSLLSIKVDKLKKILLYLVAFSAGALLGDVFIHLLPEIVEEAGFGMEISLYILSGILFSFVVEKGIHWKHHFPEKDHKHTVALMSLFGDSVHNFVDGIIIAVSYLVSIPVGIATTIAVVFHEIPQELGNFGVLLHGGYNVRKALLYNFITAITAIAGAVVALLASAYIEGITTFLIPFAAGGFIYIAGSDLIPELNKENGGWKAVFQFMAFVAGILVMLALVGLE